MIRKKLDTNQGKMKEKTRAISTHVGSRWYRAPEISLLEKQYDQAQDMWSIGCCIYELMMVVQNKKNYNKKDSILFRGDSCFPLSPCTEQRIQNSNQSQPSDVSSALHFVSEQD